MLQAKNQKILEEIKNIAITNELEFNAENKTQLFFQHK